MKQSFVAPRRGRLGFEQFDSLDWPVNQSYLEVIHYRNVTKTTVDSYIAASIVLQPELGFHKTGDPNRQMDIMNVKRNTGSQNMAQKITNTLKEGHKRTSNGFLRAPPA